MKDDDVWAVRHFVYAWFAREARAPGVSDIAGALGVSEIFRSVGLSSPFWRGTEARR